MESGGSQERIPYADEMQRMRQRIEELAALEEEEDETIAVYQRTPINTAFLGMNRDSVPFDDRQVRLAVATCIDQSDLVETVYPSESLIATQMPIDAVVVDRVVFVG